MQKDLDGRFKDIVSDAYHRIFQSYVEKVDIQMAEKVDIEKKIQHAQSEREALLKDIDDLTSFIAKEESKVNDRNREIELRAEAVMTEPVEMVADDTESPPSPEEVSKATAGNSFEIGSRVIVRDSENLLYTVG